MQPTSKVSTDTIERAARALYQRRFRNRPVLGKKRRWESPLMFAVRASVRNDAAELARRGLLNPDPPPERAPYDAE